MKYCNYHLDRNKQRGVTLVELMIAMAISLIVLLGVISVYITSKRSYVVQEEFARMQENANFAFQYLTQDIRQADAVKTELHRNDKILRQEYFYPVLQRE